MFEKALKITWVKRLCSHNNSLYIYIPLSLYCPAGVGANFLFKCNYDINSLCPKDHLSSKQEMNSETSKEKGEIMNHIILNNRFIWVNNVSVFSERGVKTEFKHLLTW